VPLTAFVRAYGAQKTDCISPPSAHIRPQGDQIPFDKRLPQAK
jgi:hypothetical protein